MKEQKIANLYRYPVKGLSPEALEKVALTPEMTLPGDRAYAIENGSRSVDEASGQHYPKIKFLMLMSHEKLATLETRYNDNDGTLTLERDGHTLASGSLKTPVGRKLIEQFLSAYIDKDLRGPPRIVHRRTGAFSDVPAPWISLVNLASIRDLERTTELAIDPLRFRANIYLDGFAPWEETAWVGRTLTLGENVSVDCTHMIERCAAINVNPKNGTRDMTIPKTLLQIYGHMNLGVYACVATSGTITLGDSVRIAS
ncbi:MAG: MOSC domain-containing protein [Parvularculales bacterium]